jgi:nickel transport protein
MTAMPGRRPPRLALAAILLAVAAAAPAHNYWLQADGDGWLLWRGHRFSSHAGEDLVPYDPAIVTRAVCADTAGSARTVPAGGAYPVRVPGPCAAVLVEADSGIWSQTLTGTRNQPPGELYGVLRSWRSFEGVKLMTAWSLALADPVSQALEISSTTDPFRLAPGDKLRLLVTWQGRPRQGVTVAYDGEPRGVTGADGSINVRIRHRGVQSITASVEEPAAEAGLDRVVRSTGLMFNLP